LRFVVLAIEVAAQRAHGCSGSSRDGHHDVVAAAGDLHHREAVAVEDGGRSAGGTGSGSVPTTKRICREPRRGRDRVDRLSGTPDGHREDFERAPGEDLLGQVSPARPSSGSISGSPGPDFTSQSASARRTESGMPSGTHSGCGSVRSAR
jgi:hypothetical protein